jgi:hypothetical protein
MPKVSVKPDWSDARKRIEAWWAGSSLGGRPAVSCRIAKQNAAPQPEDHRPRRIQEMDPITYQEFGQWLLDNHEFPAETVPGIYPYFANNLCLPAALVGGELEYRDDNTWIKEMPDIYERQLPGFSDKHLVFRTLAEVYRLYKDRGLAERALLTAPPILDGMTVLSMFRGPGNLCIDLVERPDDVRRVARHLDQVGLDTHRAFWSILEKLGHAHSVTWASIYAPGKCEMVQCDFAVHISPAMFERFVIPELELTTGYFDFSSYHLDGVEQTRFLDALCKLPRLGSIQWNPGMNDQDPLKWVDFFKQVRARKRSLWVGCRGVEQAAELTRQLGPDGIWIALHGLKSAAEAEQALARLRTDKKV